MNDKIYSNIMQQYNSKMDDLFKEYNRKIGNIERLSVTPVQFVALQNFFVMKQLEESK